MDLELPRPRLPEPYPEAKEIPYNALLDFAPFETLKEYYPCPPANVSRNLMTEDIQGAQANQLSKQDPLDPMVSIVFFLHSNSTLKYLVFDVIVIYSMFS